jgi:hypothetical protein
VHKLAKQILKFYSILNPANVRIRVQQEFP